MIGRLSGTLLEKSPPQILVDVNGLGYDIEVPMSTFYNLPNLGEPVTFAHPSGGAGRRSLPVRFSPPTTSAAPSACCSRSPGSGHVRPLAVLSGMSVAEFASAVTLQEAGRLTRIPGIGKKTAERLLLELKDKLSKTLPAVSSTVALAPQGAQTDIAHALLALGYNEKEALAALKQLPAELGVSDGIRAALKLLSKA
jgi:Holliday junction DNA helicase RuvA